MSHNPISHHQSWIYPSVRFGWNRRLLSVPALLGTLLITAGCNGSNPPLNPANTATNASATIASPPQPATVTRRDLVGQVVMNGQIIVPPSARADLYPPFHALVNKVNKSVGSSVDKGDVLVELAMPTAEAYHEQTKQALHDAEIAYSNAKQQYQAPVDAARTRLSAARSAAKNSGLSGDTQADNNQDPNEQADADQALLQAKSDQEVQMLPYKQQLDQVRAANQQARASEKQGYIRSSISGKVISLNAQPGKEVVPDIRTPVATVINLNALLIQSAMTPQQAGYIKTGQKVDVNVDEIPDKTFEGTVSRMTSLAKNRGYVAIIEFKNSDTKIKPDMKLHVAIRSGKSVKGALVVPSITVRVDSTGKPVVTVMRDGKWQTVPVNPGISDMQFTEIKSGLKLDETVQVQP